MLKLKNLVLPVSFLILTILFVIQFFVGDSPSYGESIKIILFLIPFLFVLGGSHAPVRRKILLLFPILGIILLQFDDLMIFVKQWYLTVPWLGYFIYIISKGYSDTMHLANEGRRKAVTLHEADMDDVKGLRWYYSKPEENFKPKKFYKYLIGYLEVGLTGVSYGTCCTLLALITPASFWHSLLWGSIYGFTFSVLGFVFHKYLAKPIKMDKWGWWEFSAGIATLIGVALSL